MPSARSIAGHLPTTTSRQYRPAGYIEREASPSVINRQEERAPTRLRGQAIASMAYRVTREQTLCVLARTLTSRHSRVVVSSRRFEGSPTGSQWVAGFGAACQPAVLHAWIGQYRLAGCKATSGRTGRQA